MSQENIAAVEAAYEAFAIEGLDPFLEHWTEDLDHRAIPGAADDRGPIHGKPVLRAYLQDWIDTFDGFSVRPVDLIDADEDRVVALLRYGGRARLSGVEARSTLAIVLSLREGKIARGREYATRAEALKTAGLSQ